MQFEDKDVAIRWSWTNPVYRACRHLSQEERTKEMDRIYDWYEEKFASRGLTTMSMSSKGFDLFPTGARMRANPLEGWVVPKKYCFDMNWATIRVFIGYPPWINKEET